MYSFNVLFSIFIDNHSVIHSNIGSIPSFLVISSFIRGDKLQGLQGPAFGRRMGAALDLVRN
jgi:hypothetical protein